MFKNKRKVFSLFTITFLFLSLNTLFVNMAPTSSNAVGSPMLLQDLTKQAPPIIGKMPPKVRNGRIHHAQVDLSALDSESITLNLFSDTKFVAIRDRITKGPNAGSVWIGRIANKKNSEVILARIGASMTGTVKVDGQVFEIVYAGGSVHAVHEIDPEQVPKEFEPSVPNVFVNGGDLTSSVTTTTTSSSADLTATNQIDIMVVYTTQAKINAGGDAGIQSKILNAVASANQAYLNSQVNINLNLVYMGETNYTDSGNMVTELGRIQNPSDGYMDEVVQLRKTYSADLVTLISTDSNYCGYANIMTSVSTGFSSSAYSVIHDDSVYSCMAGNNSFAHELGHNMGNVHNTENTSISGSYPDSYGYRVCGVFRDIMSYPCSGEVRIPYFSNPNLTYNGLPIGIAGSNDTARSMNATAATVAAFLTSPTSAPAAPSSLSLTSLTAGAIKLAWVDNSSNESGFIIQRSLDGSTWSNLVSLGENTATYTDSGLISGQIYYFKVTAFNSIGNSGSSNTAFMTAPAADTTAPIVTIMNPIQGVKVTGNVSVKVSASDNVKVSSIALYIDNKLVATSSSGSLSYTWNTRKIASGVHSIKAQATDSSGNIGISSVSVSK